MAASMKINEITECLPIDSSNVPEKRSGHRIIVDENSLYSIGGYNPDYWDVKNTEDTYYPLFYEFWKFNFSTRKWTKLKTKGLPYELASHTVVRDRNHLLLFGGSGVPFGNASSNDLSACDLVKHNWKVCLCTGDRPPQKYGHSMTLVHDKLYIIGGTTGYVYNMDVHCLDLATFQWEWLSGSDSSMWQPEARYRHEVVHHGKYLYLIGGGTAFESFTMKGIPVFDIAYRKWREIITQPDRVHGIPSARRCHSCVILQDDIYICGGLEANKIANDIWRLNVKDLQWTKLSCTLPVPVYFHSADVTQSGCMYIFGGVVLIDDERTNSIFKIWLKIPSLAEMCWNVLCKDLVSRRTLDYSKLRELGIPQKYIERLNNS